jgi:hypothetical protein
MAVGLRGIDDKKNLTAKIAKRDAKNAKESGHFFAPFALSLCDLCG